MKPPNHGCRVRVVCAIPLGDGWLVLDPHQPGRLAIKYYRGEWVDPILSCDRIELL